MYLKLPGRLDEYIIHDIDNNLINRKQEEIYNLVSKKNLMKLVENDLVISPETGR
jgi:hypothetical protein